jgi:hypothetical protein
MTCDAMLVFDTGSTLPSTNIKVVIKNKTASPMSFLAGDIIARAYPLVPFDYDIG